MDSDGGVDREAVLCGQKQQEGTTRVGDYRLRLRV